MAQKKRAVTVKLLKKKTSSFINNRKKQFKLFLKRRPHRSFKKTYRRDIPGRADLPGNIMFTSYVLAFMRKNWRTLSALGVIYVLSYIAFGGLASQERYSTLSDTFREMSTQIFEGEVSRSFETTGLFVSTIVGGISEPQTGAQGVYLAVLSLIVWLTLIWYARHRFNDVQVRARDALYSSGSPIVPTTLISMLLVLQLIPAAIAVIGITTLQALGYMEIGVVSMMISIVGILLVLLSLYWATATLVALVVVTVPGTYPYTAIRMAGDIVIGKRLQILLRLLWALLTILVAWILILVPIIVLESYLPWDWLPIVPLTVHLLTTASFFFFAVYSYILYRGIINESIEN